ncbi:nuclear transport factor 2 [Gautieria morchelliformis]|nr:nuclear transport factor 2 [Gautieria morchelliformis]
MADINAISKQFTEFYYTTFDSNRASLAPLYRETSMLSWEGSPFQGVSSITEKLVNLPFAKVAHQVSTVDTQPSSATSSDLVVLVTGRLTVDDSQNPIQFTQLFHLIADGQSFYVLNDVFRLIYG